MMCSLHRLLGSEPPVDSLREIALTDVNLSPQSTEASEQNVFYVHFKHIPRRPGPPGLFLRFEADGVWGRAGMKPESWVVWARTGPGRRNLSLPVLTPS